MLKNGKNRFFYPSVPVFDLINDSQEKMFMQKKLYGAVGKRSKFLNISFIFLDVNACSLQYCSRVGKTQTYFMEVQGLLRIRELS
jgi:hypothetical protein